MSASANPQAIMAAHGTISGRIRALANAGYSRSQIAKLVGRSYQQVRQVLLDEERRRAARDRPTSTEMGFREEAPPFTAQPLKADVHTERIPLDAEGRLVLTPSLIEALDARPGEWVIAMAGPDGTVALVSARTAMKQAQAIVRSFVPAGVSLSEELIAERRAEVERENSGD